MAKNKDKAKDKAEEKETKTAAPEFKYGVDDIAEELGIKPASVRVQLRNKGIEKAGKSYGWNSKAELKEVVDQLKAGGSDEDKSSKKSKKDKDDDGAKAGKKGKKGKKSKED